MAARGTWETVPAELVDGDYLQGTYQIILNGEGISRNQLHYQWVVSDFGGNEVESDTFEVAIKDAITIGYEQDFETIPSGWLSFGENNCREWGVPQYGPESAASGEKVYGTNLTADYDNNGDMTLVMPTVDVQKGPLTYSSNLGIILKTTMITAM